jgi:alkylation response protein AidB-like acyl-CoA dehydrogenase
VKVPKDQIVGEVNKGWDVAKYLLGHEREMISGMGLGMGGSLGAATKPSDALEWDSERSKGGKPARDWLRSKGNSIEGGTSEIQLNIVAKHILGLPGA